jgi:hypothetical protein
MEKKRILEEKKSEGTKPSRPNPEYERLTRMIRRRTAEKTDYMRGDKILRKLCIERRKIPSTIPNCGYTRI